MKTSVFSKIVLAGSLSLVLSTGCVTQQMYDSAITDKEALENELGAAEEDLAVLQRKQDRLHKQMEQMAQDTAQLGAGLSMAEAELARLRAAYSELKAMHEGTLSNSGQMNKALAAKQKRLLAMEENMELERQRNEELSQNLKAREMRVRELERILDEKDKAVNALRAKVSQALLGFKENDLSVEMKNGKVYVSLNEQLLFGSGSIAVDQKGVNALQQLANVLKDQKDISVLVEGHTDNVGISRPSKYMQDNWDLSVVRATAITRILTEAGVDPSRITAAGKGEHMPLTSNDTAEGKKMNRRTEIILTPKLDELFEILQ